MSYSHTPSRRSKQTPSRQTPARQSHTPLQGVQKPEKPAPRKPYNEKQPWFKFAKGGSRRRRRLSKSQKRNRRRTRRH